MKHNQIEAVIRQRPAATDDRIDAKQMDEYTTTFIRHLPSLVHHH